MYWSILGVSLYIISALCDTTVPVHMKSKIKYVFNPSPDSHRCGICPTYLQKICAYDFNTNSTYIFDNHCIMDMHNCLKGTEFAPFSYEHCLYMGNFAYVHGFKNYDMDYGEDFIDVKGSPKNPSFVYPIHYGHN